jgi:hypothetical protein
LSKKSTQDRIKENPLEDRMAAQLSERGLFFERQARLRPRSKRPSGLYFSRQWLFDFLFAGKTVLEVEGGIWVGGGHNRPSGFSKDVEKYNAASEEGYTVYRATPAMVRSGEAADLMERVLKSLEQTDGKEC